MRSVNLLKQIASMRKILLFFSCSLLLCKSSNAQITVSRNPEIAGMVREVSGDSLRSYIEKLTSFSTRHTLSTQTDKKRGIGAAREWVLEKFREFARSSDGRMAVKIDHWTLPADGKRLDRLVLMGNVMATLKGTDPEDDRIFMVSGHLDSRRTNIMDSVGPAPGANDDASGVAAVMEMARIMSRRRFSATIIFVAVSGEEQGLWGADHLAEEAKQQNWNVA